MKSKKTKGEEKGLAKNLIFISSIGISMVLAIFIGLAMGVFIDRKFSTSPWFTIIFLIFGVIAAFRNLYILAKRHGL